MVVYGYRLCAWATPIRNVNLTFLLVKVDLLDSQFSDPET